jgi:hypothetical protein
MLLAFFLRRSMLLAGDITGVFDMGQIPSARPVGTKAECLISMAQGWSLASGMQNSFSLLALAAHSSFAFPLGLALAARAGAIRRHGERPRRARAGRGKVPRAPLPAEIRRLYQPPPPPAQFFCSTPHSTPVEVPAAVVSSVAGAWWSSPGLISVPPVWICVQAARLPPLLGSGEAVCFRLLPSSFGGASPTRSATSSPPLFDSTCFGSLRLTRGEINLFSPLFAV